MALSAASRSRGASRDNPNRFSTSGALLFQTLSALRREFWRGPLRRSLPCQLASRRWRRAGTGPALRAVRNGLRGSSSEPPSSRLQGLLLHPSGDSASSARLRTTESKSILDQRKLFLPVPTWPWESPSRDYFHLKREPSAEHCNIVDAGPSHAADTCASVGKSAEIHDLSELLPRGVCDDRPRPDRFAISFGIWLGWLRQSS